VHWATIHSSQSVGAFKEQKAQEGATSPIPQPTYHGGHRILYVGSDGGHKQPIQISAELVRDFRPPRGWKQSSSMTWCINSTTVGSYWKVCAVRAVRAVRAAAAPCTH